MGASSIFGKCRKSLTLINKLTWQWPTPRGGRKQQDQPRGRGRGRGRPRGRRGQTRADIPQSAPDVPLSPLPTYEVPASASQIAQPSSTESAVQHIPSIEEPPTFDEVHNSLNKTLLAAPEAMETDSPPLPPPSGVPPRSRGDT